jgi:cell division protein FtsW
MKITGTFVISALFIITMSLVLIGVIMVFSSSNGMLLIKGHNVYLKLGNQLIFLSISLAGMSFFSLYDYNQWERKARWLLLFTIVLLASVFSPIGKEVNGAQRWIDLPFFNLQPSEVLKLTLILYLAAAWADRRDELQYISSKLFFPLMLAGIAIGLVVIEPDKSTTVLLGLIIASMWFTAGGKLLHLVPVATVFASGIVYLLINARYSSARIQAWLEPEKYQNAEAQQMIQSMNSFALGGFWGRGLGEGFQKLGFVPEVHTDFIFSTIGEELGFVWCSVILMMYLGIVLLGFWIALKCSNPFGRLIATGITAVIGLQVAMNVAVVTGAVPTTGISLPFISYGGSSLLVFLCMIGLLINVARDTFMTVE